MDGDLRLYQIHENIPITFNAGDVVNNYQLVKTNVMVKTFNGIFIRYQNVISSSKRTLIFICFLLNKKLTDCQSTWVPENKLRAYLISNAYATLFLSHSNYTRYPNGFHFVMYTNN